MIYQGRDIISSCQLTLLGGFSAQCPACRVSACMTGWGWLTSVGMGGGVARASKPHAALVRPRLDGMNDVSSVRPWPVSVGAPPCSWTCRRVSCLGTDSQGRRSGGRWHVGLCMRLSLCVGFFFFYGCVFRDVAAAQSHPPDSCLGFQLTNNTFPRPSTSASPRHFTHLICLRLLIVQTSMSFRIDFFFPHQFEPFIYFFF